MPSNLSIDGDDVTTQLVVFNQNPYFWSPSSRGITTPVLDFSISLNGDDVTLGNLSEPFDIVLPSQQPVSQFSSLLEMSPCRTNYVYVDYVRTGAIFSVLLNYSRDDQSECAWG